MSSFSSLVKISPDQTVIYFQPPYSVPSRSSLTLTNQSKRPLVLKVKTTVPDLYQVSPTLAVIEPEGRQVINITLVPTAPGELVKSMGRAAHRFLFMVAVKPETSGKFDQAAFWKRCAARDIFQQKMRCEFDDQALAAENAPPEEEGGSQFPVTDSTARPSPPVSSRLEGSGIDMNGTGSSRHPLYSLPYNNADSSSGSDSGSANPVLANIRNFVQNNVMFTIGVFCFLMSLIIIKL